MLLLLGQPQEQLQEQPPQEQPQEGSRFPIIFATDYLQTSVEVLNESTFESLLPRMNKTTLILIEKGFTVGSHQEELLKTIKERDMVVFMKDCDAGDLLSYAAVSPSGKYVAVKNNSNGRRQQVLVVNEYTLREGAEVIAEPIAELAKENSAQPPPEEEDDKSECAPAKPTIIDVASKSDEELTSLFQLLMKLSNYKGPDKPPTHFWEHLTTVKFMDFHDASPKNVFAPDWLNDRLSNGSIKSFCTIDISMYATKTPRKKWIQFTLTDAVGMNAKMGSHDDWARGYFNDFAHFYLFPGIGDDPNNSKLPSDEWTRPSIEPKTSNSSTTYTSTTGWSFGVAGGVNPDGPEANVTATYSQGNQVQRVINDFSVRNVSDGSMTGWNFYYTDVDGDKWGEHFTWNNGPKEIVDLAKSTLNFNAEALYRGPPDKSEKLPWNFQFEHQWAVLRGNYVCKWKYSNTYCHPNIQMRIDMGKVKNPK